MYAVMVKHSARKQFCSSGRVWIKDKNHQFYVTLKERGLWMTKEEAEAAVSSRFEIVVEVSNAHVNGRGQEGG